MNTLIKCPGCGFALSAGKGPVKCKRCNTVVSLRVSGLPAKRKKSRRGFHFHLSSPVKQMLFNAAVITTILLIFMIASLLKG
jgi:tRNA(Ile2) C34 agmatinyltransferase TiaS